MHDDFNDIAIVIAWPDCMARGDDEWYSALKKIGLVKNLHFKVGHAALILVEQPSGKLHYYDFGRYIAPRGYGRVRGGNTDPGLDFNFRAEIGKNNTILNIEEIVRKMQDYEDETHGHGKMYFSICNDISFEKCRAHIADMQNQKYIEYGAIAKDNTNCSRFVCDTIRAGYKERFNWKLKFPETIMPSTLGNVVNSRSTDHIYFYHDGHFTDIEFDRWDALRYFISNIWENTSEYKTKHFPPDHKLGDLKAPEKPNNLNGTAQWLGGLGEGAWHEVKEKDRSGKLVLERYKKDGEEDFKVIFEPVEQLDLDNPFEIKWGTHAQKLIISQDQKTFVSKRVEKDTLFRQREFVTQS